MPYKDKAKEKARTRRYYITHKEKMNFEHRKYYAENKDKLLAEGHVYGLEYRATHKEELTAKRRIYKANHKEAIVTQNAIYHAANKDRENLRIANYKAAHPEIGRRHKAKRRGLGYTYLNAWFAGCEGHHVDGELVINMPKKLHHSIYHRQSDGRGMAAINAVAYNYLFKQEVTAALVEREKGDKSAD